MQQERRLHSLEKIVVAVALVAVLFLAVGFAQAQEGARARRVFLRSSSVLVQDAKSGKTILAKNADAVLPIASISKLMTAMIVLDKGLDLSQPIEITDADIDTLKGTHSRLRVGSVLTRDQLLLVALMASENRAAAALCRTYPGGTPACVAAMNAKARALGMTDTHFEDPTGLTPHNVSSAEDLAKLVKAAYQYPVIRRDTTSESAYVNTRGRMIEYHNTNGLVRNPRWDIDLSKTGFINEAGRCLVMRLRVASKDLIVVLLDSWGRYSRIGDANRIRKWLESSAFERHRG
ncbi:MAG: D-alanyl-D-alanine endopeptidase [Betaproteobacteria bacterium]|nr:D-alanyl-D-alanine endopeptidase [Betaproteobacteria bacterium]